MTASPHHDNATPAPRPATAAARFARVLVATDGSPTSDCAVAWAREIAPADARVWAIHVIPRPYVAAATIGLGAGRAYEDALARGNEEAQELLSRTERELGSASHRVEGLLGFGDAAHEIVTLADAVKAELVVVGSHRRAGVERFLLGSVSEAVKDRASRSVLIARTAPRPTVILAALDGSPASRSAGEAAADLAEAWNATLKTIHVGTPDRIARFRAIRVPARARHLEMSVAHDRDVGPTIVEQADALDATLIVVGSRGYGRIHSMVVGSVGTHLARHSTASVLIVKDPPSSRDSASGPR